MILEDLLREASQLDEGDPQLEGVDGPVADDGLLARVVVLDVEVGEEDDAGVRGEEDEDVPEAVQVGEAEAGPHSAEELVVEPAEDGDDPEGDAPAPEAGDAELELVLEVVGQQADGGHAQDHEEEGVEGGREEAQGRSHGSQEEHLQSQRIANYGGWSTTCTGTSYERA